MQRNFGHQNLTDHFTHDAIVHIFRHGQIEFSTRFRAVQENAVDDELSDRVMLVVDFRFAQEALDFDADLFPGPFGSDRIFVGC